MGANSYGCFNVPIVSPSDGVDLWAKMHHCFLSTKNEKYTPTSNDEIIEFPQYAATVEYDIQSITVIFNNTDSIAVAVGIAVSDILNNDTRYYTTSTSTMSGNYYLKTINRRTVYPAFNPMAVSSDIVSRIAAVLLFG